MSEQTELPPDPPSKEELIARAVRARIGLRAYLAANQAVFNAEDIHIDLCCFFTDLLHLSYQSLGREASSKILNIAISEFAEQVIAVEGTRKDEVDGQDQPPTAPPPVEG